MNPLAVLWTSIVLGACGQVMLKHGVSGKSATTSARSVSWWLALLQSGWLWAYGFCFVGALGLWLIALSHMDVSYAFPLLSAGYVLVALLSKLFLKERVGWRRWIAIAVTSLGVMLIARN